MSWGNLSHCPVTVDTQASDSWRESIFCSTVEPVLARPDDENRLTHALVLRHVGSLVRAGRASS